MSKRQKAAQPIASAPQAILPLTDFRDDPWKTGDKNAVAFRAGIMSPPVPAEFAQQMRDEGKAAASITNLDGSSVKRDADGKITGEPLKLSDAERAALPPLEQTTSDN